ncbi:MAG: hypothetical protein QM209_00530 [Candidatus Cloacimonadota bacterium]|jgi:hypothetical protein|nr:hypothetical protein [Candidatus Cloacimonas sp.]MDD3606152.1 hypothetical protein [Candidatus Cloacimonas acidaminovorans]MDI9571647.1 hypothetical protein [Candidatus Cloacimonadota bacterium]OQC72549.1 MAG: hypothetical protein BWX46_00269 [Candidatus Cloacimonetes bacterium ADurb.Bin003]MDD5407213.1 hypothetical protein [Candidatus Cloacimonas acidaminovorans]
MINEKLENFLEKADMNYLFCLLAQLEAYRLLQLPTYVKQKFQDKITVMAMNHVAENEVPDYITELAEAELAEAELAEAQESPFQEEEGAEEEAEETIDDSKKFIEELTGTEDYEEEEEEEEEFYNEDNEDNDES